ncbi:hypothetical protein LVJ94_47675 [Pendulispora rubella]|uniref:STAS/SEC14 domain-containing protein n=1 Tax=Pendulispora rubella TaxID=2741070 RepID=A0ABZ2L1D0_9BACT
MKVERQDPILLVDLRTAQDVLTGASALDAPIAILDGAVLELPRFGMLVLASKDKGAPIPDEVSKRWKEWVESRTTEIKGKCAGIAMVTSSTAQAMVLRLAAPVIKRMFHAPTKPFSDEASARQWLTSQMT